MEMNNKRVLVVASEKSLVALELWLKDRKYNDVFPYLRDSTGNRMIGLNWRETPDARTERAGLVIVRRPDLVDRVIEMCEARKAE